MKIREIQAKTILSPSQVYDYALNPYVGCAHRCFYCYARFMKRFTGHREEWGAFVDVKANAPELLAREITRKRTGTVWISGVCDAYQPLEKRYLLTKRCIEILVEHDWPFVVQTRSPLVLRDIGTIKRSSKAEVGFSVTTADERIRRIFEPGAPPIRARVDALAVLHAAGIRTFVMIAPLLPGAETLPGLLAGSVDRVLIDRLNYHYADRIYRKFGMEWAKEDGFFRQKGEELKTAFEERGILCQVLY